MVALHPDEPGGGYAAHEAADIFPMLPSSELARLARDIAEHGLREKIVLLDGRILDGRNRQAACLIAGVTPQYREVQIADSPLAFVISANLRRRHLTTSQTAALAPFVEAEIAREAKARQVAAGRKFGRGQSQSISQKREYLAGDHVHAAQRTAEILGVSKGYVSEAKRILQADPQLHAAMLSGEVTIAEARQALRLREKAQLVEDLRLRGSGNPSPLSCASILLADPPWSFAPSSTSPNRRAGIHYPTMSTQEIMEYPNLPSIAPSAALFLWTPSTHLPDAFDVAHSWGFPDYVTSAVWVKESIGAGWWFRQRHETILLFRRGDWPHPDPEDRPDSVIEAPRGRHSEKPDFASRIEAMYPLVPASARFELFARRHREGWTVLGNEI